MRTGRLLRLAAFLTVLLSPPGAARAGFTTYLSPVDVVSGPTNDLASLSYSQQAFSSYSQAATQFGALTLLNLGPSVGDLNANLTPASVGNGLLSITLNGAWFDPAGQSPVSAGIVNTNANTADGFNLTSTADAFLRLTPDATNPAVSAATATFSFASPVQAFGLYLTGLGTQPGSRFEMMVYQNDQTTNPTIVPLTGNLQGGVQFVGFTDPGADVTSVSFQMAGFSATSRDIVGLDGISFVTVVPEPSAGVLIALGGLLLAGARVLVRSRKC